MWAEKIEHLSITVHLFTKTLYFYCVFLKVTAPMHAYLQQLIGATSATAVASHHWPSNKTARTHTAGSRLGKNNTRGRSRDGEVRKHNGYASLILDLFRNNPKLRSVNNFLQQLDFDPNSIKDVLLPAKAPPSKSACWPPHPLTVPNPAP